MVQAREHHLFQKCDTREEVLTGRDKLSAALRSRLARDEHFGRKLGDYSILCKLAAGGMSELFLAYRSGAAGFRKYVVLKVVSAELKNDPGFLALLTREAKITAAIPHPLIAQVFDLGVDRGELYVAMEYVHGVTLLELARATRKAHEKIPLPLTTAAIRDVANGLEYIHSFSNPAYGVENIVHRDIAEKNLMVTFDGSTKLIDFGIARNQAGSSLTATGLVRGTPGYMAPEVLRGQPVTARADIFSLGVVLYQCVTGYVLFPGSTPQEQMQSTLSGEIPTPSAINPEVSPALDAVILKALERDPEKRHPTAVALADMLQDACGSAMGKPAETRELLARLFPERKDDWNNILALVPDEPVVDQTGKAVLADLLEKSKISQFDVKSPVVMARPTHLPPPSASEQTETTSKDSPQAASRGPTEEARPLAPELPEEPGTDASPLPKPGEPETDTSAPKADDPNADAIAAMGKEQPTEVRPGPAKPQVPLEAEQNSTELRPNLGAAPARPTEVSHDKVSDEEAGRTRIKSFGGARAADVVERKETAQKIGVFVGALVIGGSIALVGALEFARAHAAQNRDDEEDAAPAPITRPLADTVGPNQIIGGGETGSASSGGSGSGGGSKGGGGAGGGKTAKLKKSDTPDPNERLPEVKWTDGTQNAGKSYEVQMADERGLPGRRSPPPRARR